MEEQLIQTTEGEETTKVKHRYTAGEFEGPLDLLWALIRDNKINIYDIPIAQITVHLADW